MGAPKRTKTQRERDLPVIADLYCRGLPQVVIAQRVGISRQQVGYDLADLRERWQAAAAEQISAWVARELAKIDHVERIAWEAWDKSCLDAETSHAKTIRGRVISNG